MAISKDFLSLESTNGLDPISETFQVRSVTLRNARCISQLNRAQMVRRAYILTFAALAFASSLAPLAAQSTHSSPSPALSLDGVGSGPARVVATSFPPPFPPLSTCPIKAGIQSFVLEEPLNPAGFLSVYQASLPPAAIAAFLNPKIEVRVHFAFSASDMLAHSWVIPVPLGSPAITPSNTNFDSISLATAIAQIEHVYTVCYPRPAVMVIGPLLVTAPIFGPQVGNPHGMAFSFDASNTTNLNNATNVLTYDAGVSAVVSDYASAIITPAKVSAVISGAPKINTMYKDFVLDGKSSISDSGPMTFEWNAQHPDHNVDIVDRGNPQTQIHIWGPPGDYPLTLTVTTPVASSKTTVTIHYDPDLK